MIAANMGRVAVLMGGRSTEREVSSYTGKHVHKALSARGYDAVAIQWTAHESLSELVRSARPERVWIALHGAFGEDGCVQGLLECEGIPYTGSGPLASALGMNKLASKRLFESAGVATPRWTRYQSARDVERIGYPLVVKPSGQGSSLGISMVHDASGFEAALVEATAFGGDILLEQYIRGRELSVGILDNEVLGTVEIKTLAPLFNFVAKYFRKDNEYLIPAPLDERTDMSVRELALAAHRALGCSGLSRTDILLGDDGKPVVLEVNTLPGCTETSLVTKMAGQAGMSYPELVERVLLGARLHTR